MSFKAGRMTRYVEAGGADILDTEDAGPIQSGAEKRNKMHGPDIH